MLFNTDNYKTTIAVFLILLSILLLNIFLTDFNKAWYVILGFCVIGVFSIYNIVIDNHVISMNKFHWYFQYIFMSLAPLRQFTNGYMPWGYYVSDIDIFRAQIIDFIWCFTFYFLYNFKASVLQSYRFEYFISKSGYWSKLWNVNKRMDIRFTLFSIICFCLLVYLIGFNNLFYRNLNVLDVGDGTISFIIRKILTAFPAMACSAVILKSRLVKSSNTWICLALLLLITLLSNFPTSTTRYWMGTIFWGLGVLLFNVRYNSRVMDFFILVVFFALFPFFILFKWYGIAEIIDGSLPWVNILECFNTVDFDAFSLLVRTVVYVDSNGVEYGKYLVNVLFFFIPRKLWEEKPFPSSYVVASSQGQEFVNLSCPLQAEGFLNFGIFGVVLYAIVFALICKYFDFLYWSSIFINGISCIKIVYPYLCVIVIFICRGPLQSCFIQTIMLMTPVFLIYWIEKILGKFRFRIKGV